MQNLKLRAKEFREMELRSQCLFSTREERGDEGVFFIRVRVSSSFWGSYQRRGLRGESGKFWRVRLLSIDFSVGVCFFGCPEASSRLAGDLGEDPNPLIRAPGLGYSF